MEQNMQQQITPQNVSYREIEEIDSALHRILARLLSVAGIRENTKGVLERTGGVARNRYSEKDVLEWQKKTRDEWSS
jgi:hypothetical protein